MVSAPLFPSLHITFLWAPFLVGVMQAVIASDDMGFVTEWPPEAEEIFGFAQDEVMGWSFDTFIHSIEKMGGDKKRTMVLDNILERVEGGETVTFSTVNLRADLTAFSNTVSISAREGGGTLGTITTSEDTPSIRAYNELVAREAGKALAVLAYDGRVLGVNGAFALKASANRMRILNRYIGPVEGAEYYDLSSFEGLQGVLVSAE